jgi:hypothetical protein
MVPGVLQCDRCPQAGRCPGHLARDRARVHRGQRPPAIAGVLVEHGRPENTPVVVVQSAGTDRQRRLTGRLDGLAALMEVEDVRPPATIVIGRWPLRQTRRSRSSSDSVRDSVPAQTFERKTK